MPDSSKYYVANFLSHTITVVQTATSRVLTTINFLENYDPISGAITGPVGGLPIQTPVSPDGKYMVTANTLTSTIVITDTAAWWFLCQETRERTASSSAATRLIKGWTAAF